MPLDNTDQKLVKGLVAFVVLFLIVYFYPFEWPFEGISYKREQLTKIEGEVRSLSTPFGSFYRLPDNNPFLLESKPEVRKVRYPIEDIFKAHDDAIEEMNLRIKDKQVECRMNFAPWTDVPPTHEKEPGIYFVREFEARRLRLETEWRRASVEVEDREIGFSTDTGKLPKSVIEAQENLRKLFIAEIVIKLCINAKLEQEQDERNDGKRPEAHMRLISVSPEPSLASGPFKRTVNPRYNPKVLNPRDEKSQKFFVKELSKFIQFYPVEIVMQCDVNSFMRFLHSVRTPGQFLVIRKMEMIAPFMRDSQRNIAEWDFIKSLDSKQTENPREESIWVRLSAAGMDFFPPGQANIYNDNSAGQGVEAGRTGRPTRPQRPARRPAATGF